MAESVFVGVLFDVTSRRFLSQKFLVLSSVPDILAFKLFHFPLVFSYVLKCEIRKGTHDHLKTENGNSEQAHYLYPFQL
jgi:hypothetical protein